MAFARRLELRDALKISSFEQAFTRIERAGENRLPMSAELDLRFHPMLRGFVVAKREDSRSFIPICPVQGCNTYSGGGHVCEHLRQLLEKKGAEESASGGMFVNTIDAKGVGELFKKLYALKELQPPGDWITNDFEELLNQIAADPVSIPEWNVRVKRHGEGNTLCVTLANGSVFFTCGIDGCSEPAEVGIGTTLYCPHHASIKPPKRIQTSGSETLKAFKDALTTLAGKLDESYRGGPLSPDQHVLVLVEINRAGEYVHQANGSKVIVRVSDSGQLSYLNENRAKVNYKCAIANCYHTNDYKKALNNFGDLKFICAKCGEDESKVQQFKESMRKFLIVKS